MKAVVGKRSPRWAFMTRMDILDRYGEAYLVRWRLIDTPLFGIYLHKIDAVDPQPDPHDHPWNFTSIVLRGAYTEMLFIPTHTDPTVLGTVAQQWKAGSQHKMPADGRAHRITWVDPGTYTLILRGKRRRDWGFWTTRRDGFRTLRTGWINWKDYEL